MGREKGIKEKGEGERRKERRGGGRKERREGRKKEGRGRNGEGDGRRVPLCPPPKKVRKNKIAMHYNQELATDPFSDYSILI